MILTNGYNGLFAMAMCLILLASSTSGAQVPDGPSGTSARANKKNDFIRNLKKVKTDEPTMRPTETPTEEPAKKPGNKPKPNNKKTDQPTEQPTKENKPNKDPPSAIVDFIGVKPDVLDTNGTLATPSPTISLSPSISIAPTVSFDPSASPTIAPTASSDPTASPSTTPSATPSSEPTDVPSSSPTSSTMPSMAPIPYARSDRVDLRYQPWKTLTPQQQAHASQLDYDETSWNNIRLNPVENLNWNRLSREQQTAARGLGYVDEYSWDCWQNHFQSYRWVDLGKQYVQVEQFWEQLGWDILKWNRYEDPPITDETSWYDLSEEDRYAAAQLCYFRKAWDEGDSLSGGGYPVVQPAFRYIDWTSLDSTTREIAEEKLKYSSLSWNVLGLDEIERRSWDGLTEFERDAAEEIGFTKLSWDCWQNHFRDYSWEELSIYGIDLAFMKLGWTEFSWDRTDAPPPSISTSWKDLSQLERQVATSDLCYFRDNWDGLDMTPNTGAFLHPKPKQRYVQWDEQPTAIRRIARGSLEYNKTAWNNLGTAKIEKRSWEQLTEHQKSDAMTLGFYGRTWDCFQNHYLSYEWEALDQDVQDALQVLGWSESTWNNRETETPPSYNNEWSRLSETEQTQAAFLCYFEDNWDGNSIEREIPEDFDPDAVVSDNDKEAVVNSGEPPQTDGGASTGVTQPQTPDQGSNIAEDGMEASNPEGTSTPEKSVENDGGTSKLCTISFALFGAFIQMLL